MKRKTRLILAAVGTVGVLFLLAVVNASHYTVGNITWIQFPAYSSTPMFERVYYKDELLYSGHSKRPVDINLNHNNLICITDYSSCEVFYDTKTRQFVPKDRQYDYEYADTHDDRFITDFYNVSTDFAIRWRQKALEY